MRGGGVWDERDSDAFWGQERTSLPGMKDIMRKEPGMDLKLAISS